MMLRIILPPGPMTSRILSTGIRMVTMRGANDEMLSRDCGDRLAASCSRMCSRPRRACSSALRMISVGDAADLDVHLQRGDAVGGAGDLEVHVAVVVLGAGDVGEHGVLAGLLVHHQAHRDAGHRRLERHAGIHHRQRCRRRPTPSRMSRSTRGCPTRRGRCRGTVPRPASSASARVPRARRGRFRGGRGRAGTPTSPTENGGKL